MSMPLTHALIIGKFYPPHKGHHLLVDTAAAACARVSVVVMAASCESIPLETRVAWMIEAHHSQPNVVVVGVVDDVPIDYEDPSIWSQHEDLMRQALDSIGAPPVTHVFSSESYGDELARRFAARSVILDLARSLVPVSATQVRADPAACWEFLSVPVRRDLALRVVVVGAESSGTTTLSRDLASEWRLRCGTKHNVCWVPEYGREYTVSKLAVATARAQLTGLPPPDLASVEWESNEFEHIARRQQQLEDEAASAGGPLLICDTDVLATAVWHERYVGTWREELTEAAGNKERRLYLVTDHRDVPFEQDGLRDGENQREWMTERFRTVLAGSGLPFEVLTGNRKARLARSLELVEQLMAKGWCLAPPLTERRA
jgi:NadR type nicotinamide-nucleotide adenylyltransferase